MSITTPPVSLFVLLFLALSLSTGWGFAGVKPPLARSLPSSRNDKAGAGDRRPCLTRTRLHLGIRDAILRKVHGNKDRGGDNSGKRDSDGDGNNDEDDDGPDAQSSPSVSTDNALNTKESLANNADIVSDSKASSTASKTYLSNETTTSLSEASTEQGRTPATTSPLRMGEDPASKQINVHRMRGMESIQERINRVKAGRMTQDEKEAFLQTALSAGNTPESRRPMRLSKNGNNTDGSNNLDSLSRSSKKAASASPFPTDSILRDFARGTKASSSSVADAAEKKRLDTEAKKRQYYDMVTDPNRFSTFRTSPLVKKPAAETTNATEADRSAVSGGSMDDSNQRVEDLSTVHPSTSTKSHGIMDAEIIPDDPPMEFVSPRPAYQPQYPPISSPSTPPSSPYGVSRSSSSSDNSPRSAPPPLQDLGARLEAAAVASEERRRKAEEERKIREEQEREAQRERERRLAVEQQRRKEELQRQQDALAQERMREEQRVKVAEAEKQRLENEKMEQLIKAQDEYWAKKLAAERAMKERAASEPSSSKKSASMKSSSVDTIRASMNPDEHSILEKAAEDPGKMDWERNHVRIDETYDRLRNVPPAPHVVQTVEGFRQEQQRRKQQQDWEKDEQLRKLRALNSPLPAPVPKKPAPVSPAMQTNRRTGNSVPALSRNTAPRYEDGSLSSPLSPGQAPMPVPDAVDRKKTIAELQAETDVDSGRSKAESNPLLNWFGGGGPSKGAMPFGPAATSSKENTGSDAVDDIYDEEEDGVRDRTMSIADAVKKSKGGDSASQDGRSKMWGVDISKFT